MDEDTAVSCIPHIRATTGCSCYLAPAQAIHAINKTNGCQRRKVSTFNVIVKLLGINVAVSQMDDPQIPKIKKGVLNLNLFV